MAPAQPSPARPRRPALLRRALTGSAILVGILLILWVVGLTLFQFPAQALGSSGYLYGRIVATGTATTPGLVRLDGGTAVQAQVQAPQAEGAPTPEAMAPVYRDGQRVQVAYSTGPDGGLIYAVSDYQRGPALYWLLILFVAVVALVGRAKGLRAVAGTAASLGIVGVFIVPAILRGASPVLVALVGSGGILALSMYFVHGVNWKTTAALAGTLVTVLVALLVGGVFLHLAHVTSFGDEDSVYVAVADPKVNLQGLVLAGVVIGALGALVDVTIGQASTVSELAHLGPRLRWWELYARAMNVGLDHIGSLVNTLVLAYVSSALPILLLLHLEQQGWRQNTNLELVAVEAIHMLCGATALVLAVPLTTLVAALLFRGDQHHDSEAEGHGHGHTHSHGAEAFAGLEAAEARAGHGL